MKRSLSVAIALALTVLAGCSTSSDQRERAAVVRRENAPSPLPSAAEPRSVVVDAAEQSSDKETRQPLQAEHLNYVSTLGKNRGQLAQGLVLSGSESAAQEPVTNTENYQDIATNPLHRVAEQPVSTFSIDVDTGSYANVRRMLNAGQLPPSDAVRAEELINYFDYDYPVPVSTAVPFSVTTEMAPAPWNIHRHLLLVGIKGYQVAPEKIPASNVVFLIDTSGSMQSPDKLELLKQSLGLMVAQLRPQDRVAIVTYAGSAGLVLPSTTGEHRGDILAALERLEAGGSTNGGAGIQLAYDVAQKNFIEGGINRVILVTDGDFNVGTVDIDALKTLVAAKRQSGVALTTLGFGTGNYNDEMAEQLADIGNGNHAYIDTLNEGRKVLVDELSSTMMIIAKDVKIQIEFNPAVVVEYRLIGYENRLLRREDFNNDRIDAGEIGAGHDVTALYEIALAGSGGEQVEPLRYGDNGKERGESSGELGFLRLRYKQPNADTSQLIETPVHSADIRHAPSARLALAAAVAGFADVLRGGDHLGEWNLDDIRQLAAGVGTPDPFGYRAEFLTLIDRAVALNPQKTEKVDRIAE